MERNGSVSGYARAMAQEQTATRPAGGGAALRQQVTDAITEATFAELAESGYARLSMEAVARRAGVGKAALYRRWSSKQEMIAELIRQAVRDTLPPIPDTGALHTDLRQLLTTFRDQLSNPAVRTIGVSLFAEAHHNEALAEVLQTTVAAPRRENARRVLRAAMDRGELPDHLDVELASDLFIAPLGFRILVLGGDTDDAYLDVLAAATEAALKVAVRKA
jgi:AcrR family transcriptional regulator